MILGQDKAVEQFASAWQGGKLHHAWLLSGPKGVGKGLFARLAATRVLAEAAGPPVERPGIATPEDHPVAKLVKAGSHPDMRWLERLEKEKGEGLARNITVRQVRELGEFLGLTPALSPWRVVVIDSADDLEGSGANALLKMLEEPPPNSLFLLVSHNPGRLLPTIRSRCRKLAFTALADEALAAVLAEKAPELGAADRDRLVAMSAGSAGRALAFAGLDLVPLEQAAIGLMREGDPTNEHRSRLAAQFGRKTAADRYQAFLDLLPLLVAREARQLNGNPWQKRALDAYADVREIAGVAPRLSLDPAATVFQLAGILASVASPVP